MGIRKVTEKIQKVEGKAGGEKKPQMTWIFQKQKRGG